MQYTTNAAFALQPSFAQDNSGLSRKRNGCRHHAPASRQQEGGRTCRNRRASHLSSRGTFKTFSAGNQSLKGDRLGFNRLVSNTWSTSFGRYHRVRLVTHGVPQSLLGGQPGKQVAGSHHVNYGWSNTTLCRVVDGIIDPFRFNIKRT